METAASVPPFLHENLVMKFLRTLSWLFRALLFVLLFLFALKNTDVVALKFYFGQGWQAPLVLVLVAFFALGALFGILACLSTLLRQRREILVLKRRPADPGEPPLAAPPVTES